MQVKRCEPVLPWQGRGNARLENSPDSEASNPMHFTIPASLHSAATDGFHFQAELAAKLTFVPEWDAEIRRGSSVSAAPQ